MKALNHINEAEVKLSALARKAIALRNNDVAMAICGVHAELEAARIELERLEKLAERKQAA